MAAARASGAVRADDNGVSGHGRRTESVRIESLRIESLRIDKALWYLRLAPTRAAAQALVAAGHIRLDGRRVERASTAVRAGALLVIPGPPRIRVLRLVDVPRRRGPPAEAAACYVDMGLAAEIDVDTGAGSDGGAVASTGARPG